MIKAIKQWLPDPKRKQGLKNPKLYSSYHFIGMTVSYGTPKNYNSQCLKQNHKYSLKSPECRPKKGK